MQGMCLKNIILQRIDLPSSTLLFSFLGTVSQKVGLLHHSFLAAICAYILK